MKYLLIICLLFLAVSTSSAQAPDMTQEGIIVYSPESDCFVPRAFESYRKAKKYVKEINRFYGTDFPEKVKTERRNRLYEYGENLREHSEAIDSCMRFRYVVSGRNFK